MSVLPAEFILKYCPLKLDHCPSGPQFDSNGKSLAGNPDCGYGMRRPVFESGANDVIWFTSLAIGSVKWNLVLAKKIVYPSKTFLLADTLRVDSKGNFSQMSNFYMYINGYNGAADARHSGSVNIAFPDGHAASLPASTYLLEAQESIRQEEKVNRTVSFYYNKAPFPH